MERIVIDPKGLKEKANEFDNVRERVRVLIADIDGRISGLNAAWQSDAATTYQQSFKQLSTSIENLDRIIRNHVTNLNAIADEMLGAEAKTQSEASELPKAIQ